MAITFHFEKPVPITERRRLKQFIKKLINLEGKETGKLSYVFCSDEYLLHMNRQFLDHDYFTDIITFDMAEEGSGLIEGELYISIDRIKDNALTHNVHWQTELHRVMFHGILHLCGYNDKSRSEQDIMRHKEGQYLSLYSKM